MITHAQIDRRLLRMVSLCVAKIDARPPLLLQVVQNANRIADPRIRAQWRDLLELPWPALRDRLLADDEPGAQLRQNAPLGGLLSNAERFAVFQEP